MFEPYPDSYDTSGGTMYECERCRACWDVHAKAAGACPACGGEVSEVPLEGD